MGKLSAPVAEEVFTLQSSDSVSSAIKAVATKSDVLLVVKNYTGDWLNFGLAAEMARSEGILVEMVIVDADLFSLRPSSDEKPISAKIQCDGASWEAWPTYISWNQQDFLEGIDVANVAGSVLWFCSFRCSCINLSHVSASES